MLFPNKPTILWLPRTEISGWLFFFFFVALASVRAKAASADSDADDALSDFTNDLFTDLGPLLALFGEQMTKQYISESTTFYDYFIFGMGPIGVITTIVSTIRLCGPASLRAFIGRSQEGNSAIEAELCASTSRDVCEVFNNGGITRVLGRPKILELIHVPQDYLPYAPDHRKLNRKVGLYLFRDFVEDVNHPWYPQPSTRPEWSFPLFQQLSPASQNPPNLSLNVGITQYDSWVFFFVALVGLILQVGVLVVAGVGVWVWGWNLNESTTVSTNYAPTIFIIGTVSMCGGMCACIAIIGQATTEVRCRRGPSVTGSPVTSLLWLQPRQVIADQSFDAYAFIEDDKKRLLFWTSSMKTWDLNAGSEIKFKSATCIAVLAVLVGYILQFIGLRGMRAWVSIAQLITTVVMSILRGVLRMQRLKKNDNKLYKKAELVPGHELDWLAIEISKRTSENGQITLEKKPTIAEPLSSAVLSEARNEPSYQNLMNLRICLAGMTGHISQHVTQTRPKLSQVPWDAEGFKVHDKARDLTAALEQIANNLCKGTQRRMVSLRLPGSQFCRPPGITNKSSEVETWFQVSLERPGNQFPSNWRVDHVEIEAILGLALWSLISDPRLLNSGVSSQLESTQAGQIQTMRIISAGLSTSKLKSKPELACWLSLLETENRAPINRVESQEVAFPLNLDSYSIGSLWQVDHSHSAFTTDFDKSHWVEVPGQTVGRATVIRRFCGWSCLLEAQQNLAPAKESWSAKAPGHPKKPPKVWAELVTTDSSLLDICAQEIFGAFLSQLQIQVDADRRSLVQERLNLRCLEDQRETVRAIRQTFVTYGLGSEVDAAFCILPAIDNRRIDDRDRLLAILSPACDSLLEMSELQKAFQMVEYAVETLCHPETREEELLLARILCVQSKIQRLDVRNTCDSLKTWSKCKRWSGSSTEIFDTDDFQVAIKDLWEIHWRLQYCRTYFGRKIEPVYDTLLEALVKKDRFATLYFLAKVALNPLSAQEMDSASAALPLAAKYGWFEAVDALLNMGFDPLAEDEAGRTALGYCAEYAKFEHEACAEVFLSHERALDASKSASWSGDDGRTPLLWAVTHGHEGMVRIFVRKGFPLVEQGSGRLSPLTEAVSKGFEEIALQLIDAGTELRKKHLALANLDNSLQGPVTACLRAQIVEFGDYWSQQMLEIIVDNDFHALQLLFNLGIRVEFRQVVLAVRTGHQEVKQLFLGEFPGWVAANPEDTKEGRSKLESDNDWYIMQVLLDHGGSAVYAGFQA